VYYDLGNLGTVTNYYVYPPTQVTFDNSVGKQVVQAGFNSWSSIPTSSFRANVIGDFSLLGLPNITSTNVGDIIGGPERYGVFVIFDEDGSIMQNFLGAPDGVLGISTPQYSNGTTITMSWTVLNGSKIDPNDPNNAENFQGVATHEFGHALGMAHTQTNGAAYFHAWTPAENVQPLRGGSSKGVGCSVSHGVIGCISRNVNSDKGTEELEMIDVEAVRSLG
jgi:hypothetical protein